MALPHLTASPKVRYILKENLPKNRVKVVSSSVFKQKKVSLWSDSQIEFV